jgi:hypothetical protein
MSLYGSIREVQNTTEKFYLNLEQRFSENKLVKKLWSQMAQDISQQIASLHDLPQSFWAQLKKDQDELLKTIQTGIKPQNIENALGLSLSGCIESAIHSEEAIILKIYVPLIRNLRKDWTGQALDFYIMVKAHIVRIKRVAEAFSGDPVVWQYSSLLFQSFEKEVQEPEVEIIQKIKPAAKSRIRRENKTKKPESTQKPKAKSVSKAKQKKSSKQSQSVIARAKRRRSPAKPIVEKSDLRRRRARR